MTSTLNAIREHLARNASSRGIFVGEALQNSFRLTFPSKKSAARNLKKITELACRALSANSIEDSQIDVADLKIQILKDDHRIQVLFSVDGKVVTISTNSCGSH